MKHWVAIFVIRAQCWRTTALNSCRIYSTHMKKTRSQSSNDYRIPPTGYRTGRTLQRDHDLKTLTLYDRAQKELRHVCISCYVRKNVHFHHTTKFPSFRLAITRLVPGLSKIACPMLPDAKEMDSLLAYWLPLFHQAILLRKIAKNFQEGK